MLPEELAQKINDETKPPLIMGILNVTPDSFYDGGRYSRLDRAVARVEQMIEEGADIIDVGGESSRPGSDPVTLEEEVRRVVPVIEELRKRFSDLAISVDTYKAAVAERALEIGVSMINDISAGRFDGRMYEVMVRYKPVAVLMHMKGTPKDMQKNPVYEDVVSEVYAFLEERKNALVDLGFPKDRVVVDYGIGFGKRLEDNLALIANTHVFSEIAPVLVGPSRKSFIGMVLDLPPEERLEGTLAAVSIAVYNGARILRVHDVKESKRAALLAWEIANVGRKVFKV